MASSEYDFEALVAAYSDSPEILNEILGIFLEETPQRIANLENAVAEEDFSGVHRIAHGLANTTGTLRAEHALKTAREIEQHAWSENIEPLPPLVERLETEVNEMLDKIREYREGA